MTREPADTLPLTSQAADSLRTLNAELLGAMRMNVAQLRLNRSSQAQSRNACCR